MTSLDRRDNVSDGETAIPGEVRRWRAFWLLAVAYFMTIIDLTIVNVALPTIGRKLHFPGYHRLPITDVVSAAERGHCVSHSKWSGPH